MFLGKTVTTLISQRMNDPLTGSSNTITFFGLLFFWIVNHGKLSCSATTLTLIFLDPN